MINQNLTQSRTKKLPTSKGSTPSYKSMMKKVLLQRMKCDSQASEETNRTIQAHSTSKTAYTDEESNLQIYEIPNLETQKNKIMAYSQSLTVIDQYYNIQSITYNKNFGLSQVLPQKKLQLTHRAYTQRKNPSENNQQNMQHFDPNRSVLLHPFYPETKIDHLLPTVSENRFDNAPSKQSLQNLPQQQKSKNRKKQTCQIKVQGQSILSSMCCFRRQNKQGYVYQAQPPTCLYKLKKFVKPLQKSQTQQEINKTFDSQIPKKRVKVTLQNQSLIKK